MTKKGVEPPSVRSIWIFSLLGGLVVAVEFIFDGVVPLLLSIAFGTFAMGYFLRYYLRTGNNVIEDAVAADKSSGASKTGRSD